MREYDQEMRGRTHMPEMKDNSNNKITRIEDIAKDAGVGKGTVDRVLHNRGYVSEETRRKVEESISRLGYKPNIAARMLAKRKTYRIAVVYHNSEKEFWGQVEQGIERAAEEFRVSGVETHPIVLAELDGQAEAEAIREVIREGYDGLAIVPYHSENVRDALAEAKKAGIPIVTFNNYESPEYCYVGDNTLQSGRTAGRIMCETAPENAAYLILEPGRNIMTALDDRLRGFLEVVEKDRPDLRLCGRIDARLHYRNAEEEIGAYLKREHIDLIYATNVIAAGAAETVEKLELEKSVRIIGHDLTESMRKYIAKGIIRYAVGQEPERQGYLAVAKLARHLLMDEDSLAANEYTRIEIAVAENIDFI